MKNILGNIKSVLKRFSKPLIIALCAMLIIALTAGFMMPGRNRNNAKPGDAAALRTSKLEKGDLASTISTTGTIYSVKSTEVYSNLNYSVKTVNVSVGDNVKAGDLIAELDPSDLISDISQRQAALESSKQSAQQRLSTAEQDLITYQKNIENNYDTSIINAEATVKSCELEIENAELVLRGLELDLKNAEIELKNAKIDIETASTELLTARRRLSDARNNEGDYEFEAATDSQIRTLRDTVSAKESALEKAENALTKRETDYEKARTSYEKSITDLEKAYDNLEKANASLVAANESASDTIASYQDKVRSAQIDNNFDEQYLAIMDMQSDVEKCKITAPVSGTVTAVNAVEGGSGNGLLFVIQNIDSLKVVTNIKEYDMGAVNLGDKVIIKTDATGEKEFRGTLTKIAPTSALTATGTASASTEAEYESEVVVDSFEGDLKIGMNARLSIITEEKKNIFYVPYEAVDTENGKSVIYVQKVSEDGSVSIEAIEVTMGLETNLYVEISGDKLKDGMEVVKSASSVDKSLIPGNENAENPGASGDSASRGGGGGGIRIGGPR